MVVHLTFEVLSISGFHLLPSVLSERIALYIDNAGDSVLFRRVGLICQFSRNHLIIQWILGIMCRPAKFENVRMGQEIVVHALEHGIDQPARPTSN